jgi:hypothetical protein
MQPYRDISLDPSDRAGSLCSPLPALSAFCSLRTAGTTAPAQHLDRSAPGPTAVALIAGIAARAAAGITALLLAEIVIWLTTTTGLSDLTMRDVGVLGLAVCMTGATEQRLALAS